jgi:hypothetical protein
MTAQKASSLPVQGGESELEIIFSSKDGYVWASWQETDISIRLGRHEMISEMMRDFLAQEALGQRLANCDRSEP